MVLAKHFFDIFCITECCSNYWIPNNTTELDVRFKSQLIGQPLVHNLILNSISSHLSNPNPSKALVLSLHGSTGTGKNFVAKHIVESLYRQGYKSRYVKLYVVSRDFMHNDEAHIREYKDRLTNEIERATSSCEQTMFIFDEIDQMPSQLLDVILYYLDFHSPTRARKIDFRKTFFLFLSNAGGEKIIDLTKKFRESSIPREEFPILDFDQLLSNVSFHEKGGFQNAAIIKQDLITFFVPFLPLERSHIRSCAQQQLKRLLEYDKYEYKYSENDVIDKVLNLIEFSASDSYEYALSGCKRVEQKLSFIFESLRSNLPRKEKPFHDNL